ncbi:MAG: hypothetical protein ACPGWR_28035, partial [Ardenticatenaceae bacterium]
KQGCLFYLNEQAGMRVLPRMNKQGCLFYLNEQAGMRVLPRMNKQGCLFYLNEQAGMRVLPNEQAHEACSTPEQAHEACSTKDANKLTRRVLPKDEQAGMLRPKGTRQILPSNRVDPR